MSCGIYKITNNINSHSYIGQSINIEERWRHHKRYDIKRSQYPLYRAFEKYGLNNFSWEILEECSEEELDTKEEYYIQLYNTYLQGYNQTLGGQGSKHYSIKLSAEDINIIYDLLLNSNIPQNDIAQMFNVGADTISEINQGKTRINPNLSYPLRINKYKKYCKRCGKEICHESTYCSSCKALLSRVVERPDRSTLKQLIRTNSFLSIGKQFNVSDNTIRKWCIAYHLPSKKKDIKTYSNEEWNLV